MRWPVLAVVSGVLIAAGCGGDGDDKRPAGGPTAPPGPALAPAAPDPKAVRKFEECLRDNGVDPPRPEEGEFRPPPREVMDKCRRHLPGGGEGPVQAPLPQSPGP